MKAALVVLLTPLAALAACGGGGDDTGDDIAGQLGALGIEVQEVHPPDPEPGLRYFDLWFTEPVDHDAPGGATFRLYGALIHRDAGAPMVIYTSGYGAGRARRFSELAELVGGNQLSLDYRYYATSLPAAPDWTTLDVEQASADIHDVVAVVKPLYAGAWLDTGGSKGGETTLHSHYLYPDDFAGSVAYVTPVRLANPDPRYTGILDQIGTDPCRTALRAAQREMLTRRDAMVARTEASGAAFTILTTDYATEISIVETEWSFWQYRGESECDQVPPTTVDDDTLYAFLDATSPPTAYADDSLLDSYEQFSYQAMTQLGYPVIAHDHLTDLELYDYQDLTPFLPDGVDGAGLVMDPSFNQGLLDWAATDADHLMIVDGEWDPWSGGANTAVVLNVANDARRYVVPHGTHGSSIDALPDADRTDAYARISRWAGVPVPRLAAPRARRTPDPDDLMKPPARL